MTATSVHRYLSNFTDFDKQFNGQAGAPIHQLRRRAMARFEALGFPTSRDEEWRATNLTPLTGVEFAPVSRSQPASLTAVELAPFTFAGLEGLQLVFVDGHYAPSLSRTAALPDGAVAVSMAEALERDPASLDAHLGRYATGEQEPFTSLNTAFIGDGAYVCLPGNAVVEQPIHLLFVSTGGQRPTVSHPRVLIVAAPGSQATLIESYAGLQEACYFTNAVTEVVAGEGAVIDHYRIQRESAAAFHLSELSVQQACDVRFRSTSFTLGGRLTRNRVHTILDGEGIDSTLNGLYLVAGSQHVDNQTSIEHRRPHSASHQYYKGVLDGRASGVFRGRILVHQAAQQTNAYQANRNLLLSAEADIDTRPQLEIYADDVKCSHGATVGRLDEEALFYLRSRGIDRNAAGRILTRAFAGEIVERVRLDPVCRKLDSLVTERLAGKGR